MTDKERLALAKETLAILESKANELRKELLWQEELISNIRSLTRRLEDIAEPEIIEPVMPLYHAIKEYMAAVNKLYGNKMRGGMSTAEYSRLLKDIEEKELAINALGVSDNFTDFYFTKIRQTILDK